MKYYAVVEVNISNDSWMADYIPNVTTLVRKHGGKFLARSMTMEKIEGSRTLPNAFVIIEWPSKDAAKGRRERCVLYELVQQRPGSTTQRRALFAPRTMIFRCRRNSL